MGITLLLRPSTDVKQKIADFLIKIRKVAPQQYYYPESDLHITVLSIISCYAGFEVQQINTADYISGVKHCLKYFTPFKIHFKGVALTNTGIILQGFPADEQLNTLRDKLRKYFKNSDLQQSIDSRYALETAHSTVMRYTSPVENKDFFINTVENFRAFDFGYSEVTEMELVYNDWYQRKANTKILSLYSLKPQPF